MQLALKQSDFKPFSITASCPHCEQTIRTGIRRIETKQFLRTKKSVIHTCPLCDFVLAEIEDY
jgi:hypothetical protein